MNPRKVIGSPLGETLLPNEVTTKPCALMTLTGKSEVVVVANVPAGVLMSEPAYNEIFALYTSKGSAVDKDTVRAICFKHALTR